MVIFYAIFEDGVRLDVGVDFWFHVVSL